MSCIGQLAVISQAHDRAARRRMVNLAAHAREANAAIFAIQVRDLSTDGCRIAGDFHLEQATVVWVKIPGMAARKARVVWSREKEAGCEFATPVDQGVLDEIGSIATLTTRAAIKRRGRDARKRGL